MTVTMVGGVRLTELTENRRPRRRFLLLGSLELWHGDHEFRVTGKGLSILAGLLLGANNPVSTSDLMTIVWGTPSGGSRTALHALISRLRQMLGGRVPIHTVENGYLIDVAPGELDLHDFHDAIRHADQAAATGDVAAERRYLSEAAALWRGPALAGVPSERLRKEHGAHLDEKRLWVLSRQIDLDIAAGRSAAVIGGLLSLVAQYPLNEGFAGQLMTALHRCSRRAEALAVYRNLRKDLVERAGIEPGVALTTLHSEILADKSVQAGAATVATSTPSTWDLPVRAARITGREREIGDLVSWLAQPGPARRAVVSGMPGVGKSAVALEAAHQSRRHFPDGQWYVRHGSLDGVLRDVLSAAGVPADRIPREPHVRAEVLRTALNGRRVLLVVDGDARATGMAELFRLLPRTPGFAVLTAGSGVVETSSDSLSVRLKPLAEDSVLELFSGQEPSVARQLARLCAGLPAALHVVRRLLAQPGESGAGLVDRLRDPRSRLEMLRADGTDVRAGFATRYASLAEPAQVAFRRIGLLPPMNFCEWSVGTVTGGDGTDLIGKLVAADLVEPLAQSENGDLRYRMHALVALYARELAENEPHEINRAAVRRLVDALLNIGTAVRRTTLWTSETIPEQYSSPEALRTAVRGIAEDPVVWVHRHGALFLHTIRQARLLGWKAEAERLIDIMVTTVSETELPVQPAGGGRRPAHPARATSSLLWDV
jgi:DNA-binding SARP family transcriptional activator